MAVAVRVSLSFFTRQHSRTFVERVNAIAVFQTRYGRHRAQRGQLEEAFEVLRRLECIVQMLLQESGTGSEAKTQEKPHGQIQEDSRARRFLGRIGRINDADVRGLEARRDSSLFELFEQANVKLFVGVGLALQDVVLD